MVALLQLEQTDDDESHLLVQLQSTDCMQFTACWLAGACRKSCCSLQQSNLSTACCCVLHFFTLPRRSSPSESSDGRPCSANRTVASLDSLSALLAQVRLFTVPPCASMSSLFVLALEPICELPTRFAPAGHDEKQFRSEQPASERR